MMFLNARWCETPADHSHLQQSHLLMRHLFADGSTQHARRGPYCHCCLGAVTTMPFGFVKNILFDLRKDGPGRNLFLSSLISGALSVGFLFSGTALILGFH